MYACAYGKIESIFLMCFLCIFVQGGQKTKCLLMEQSFSGQLDSLPPNFNALYDAIYQVGLVNKISGRLNIGRTSSASIFIATEAECELYAMNVKIANMYMAFSPKAGDSVYCIGSGRGSPIAGIQTRYLAIHQTFWKAFTQHFQEHHLLTMHEDGSIISLQAVWMVTSVCKHTDIHGFAYINRKSLSSGQSFNDFMKMEQPSTKHALHLSDYNPFLLKREEEKSIQAHLYLFDILKHLPNVSVLGGATSSCISSCLKDNRHRVSNTKNCTSKRPPLRDIKYSLCAVVGNAIQSLAGENLGKFIDTHDMILRINTCGQSYKQNAAFVRDFGQKTTHWLPNTEIVRLVLEGEMKPHFGSSNLSILYWDQTYSGLIPLYNNSMIEPLPISSIRPLAEEGIMRCCGHTTNGFYAVAYALSICKKVHVFGMTEGNNVYMPEMIAVEAVWRNYIDDVTSFMPLINKCMVQCFAASLCPKCL